MAYEIRFLSSNKFKLEEAKTILGSAGVDVLPISAKIEELQTTDTNRLVKDKALKAFEMTGRPLFIEHTGLYLEYMNGFPGGLTQIFWDNLQADRFSELFGGVPVNSVKARTVIGFVDGQRYFQFEGEVNGSVATSPKGNRDFQWDCVFVPDGQSLTFAEMGDKKNEISMRRKALDSFASFLKARGHV